MTGGSDDARPPEGEQEPIDAGWDALVEGVERASPGVSERSGTSERSGSHHAAVGKDRLAEPDQEMDRLMSGARWVMPTIDDDEPAEGDSLAASDASLDSTASDSEARDTKTSDDSTASDSETRDTKTSDYSTASDSEARDTKADDDHHAPSGPALTVLSGGSGDDLATSEPRAFRPAKPPPRAAEPEPATGRPWMWVGAVAVVAGVVAFLGLRDDDPPTPKRPTVASAPETPTPDVPPPTPPPVDPTPEATSDETGVGSSTGSEPSTAPGADPRVPPPNTSPEAAEAFTRLPVSPSDRPPVGGIGATGIHIDHITMGSRVEGGECRGHRDDFSVSRRESATVCVRVVHQREKEELQVLWEKHEGATRRSKMVVQPRHAYRTRGYLKLRKEYIGDWTVKILSSDDVELARHDFTVVP